VAPGPPELATGVVRLSAGGRLLDETAASDRRHRRHRSSRRRDPARSRRRDAMTVSDVLVPDRFVFPPTVTPPRVDTSPTSSQARGTRPRRPAERSAGPRRPAAGAALEILAVGVPVSGRRWTLHRCGRCLRSPRPMITGCLGSVGRRGADIALPRRPLQPADHVDDGYGVREPSWHSIVPAWRPALLALPAVGPINAASVLTAWSPPGRRRSHAAASSATSPASSTDSSNDRPQRLDEP
jgi:hypothetical protein